MILVSVIVPIYNQERFLLDCLASIERQTLLEKEIILVNDGSTDRSQEIIDAFCDDHPDLDICTLWQENQGQSVARNNGIKHSRGKYLYFLDSDDSIDDDCLTLLVNYAEKKSADVVIGENNIIKDSHKEYNQLGFLDDFVVGNDKILEYYVNRLWYNVAWNKLVKAEIIKNNELFFLGGCIFEDNLWSFQLATCINVLGVVHKPTYNYYIRKDSKSTMNENAGKYDRWLKFLPILSEMSSFICNKSLNKNVSVNFFFMRELNFALYGLDDCGKLTRAIFNKIKNMADFNVVDIYKYRKITFKELVVFYFYNLPTFIDYPYFKIVNLYLQMKKHLR